MSDAVLRYLRAVLAVPVYSDDHKMLITDTYPTRGSAFVMDVVDSVTGKFLGTYRVTIEEED